jgi:RHS repeat-associated protein
LNQQTTFTYDSMNRLTKVSYPTSPATYTQFGYDYRGRKISVTDPNTKITQYSYDDADRLLSVTDPNNGATQYAYDNESNLTSISDAAMHATGFLYDGYGHVTQTNFPSSWTETYSYDLDGNLLTKTDRNGHVINYGYDFLNRLTSKSYPDSTAVNYTYDLANRLTQVADPTGTYGDTYDNMGRLTQTSTAYAFVPGKTFTVGYSYDAASNRSSMTDPQNAATGYVYDTLNRMTTLTYPSRTNYTFTYDALGRRTQLSRPNGIASNYQYDSLSRLLSVLHQAGTTVRDGATYVYDPAGTRTSKTDKRTSVTSSFSYDPLYELTQVVQGSTTAESYSYDAIGNRLSSLGVSPYAYNTSNELTSYPGVTSTYDNNGNSLTKVTSAGTTGYSWDFENRLTTVTLPGSGGAVNFKYDPFGHRVQKSSSSGTTNYVYDGANVLEDVDGSGNVLARYVQSIGVDQPLAETRGSTTSYYQADGLGSVTSLSNSSGALANTYTYDSFGMLTASTGTITNPYRYTGREVDSETGLDYYRARYYDPNSGRFISEDPISFGGGANFYEYVRNNPAKLIDPSGLADVYIWAYTGSTGNWGHASLVLNDGTYISWWPGDPHEGKLPNIYSAPALPPNLARDQEEENTSPTVIHLDNLDEDAIQRWWDKFRQKHKWKTFSQNCSTTVADALDAGGGQSRAPFAPHQVVWTPADVEEYARQVQAAGRGTYIPPWVYALN